MFRLLFPLIFIAVPLAEITLFVIVGGQIGVFMTIGLVILTAVIGTILLRLQGFAVLSQLRRSLDQGQMPVGAVIDGAFLLVAGILLLTPGFFTDTIGFTLFIPAVRQRIARWIGRYIRTHVEVQRAGSGSSGQAPVIDGEIVSRDDETCG